ncbi:MAG: hypothetical protein ACQEXO_17095 [Pseudomonadota bacterium]
MPDFSDDELVLIMSDLDEHASTLRALRQRLEATDPDAALSLQGVAHELWEIRKALGDGRRSAAERGQHH